MRTTRSIRNLARQVVARCRTLARFSEDRGTIRRTFLSPAMHDCHRAIGGWLKAAGANVTIDAAGNLRGFYAPKSTGPRILMGSHLDTVPDGGAFDGVLGVILPVALLEALKGRRLPFGIEVVGFSEEEGVRFGTPFLGSRALVGTLDTKLLNLRDSNGISVRTAIRNFGLNPAKISSARLSQEALAYLEFHIEQGPVLESLGRPLGLPDAIVGQTRVEFRFLGHANHAGTTPMKLRRDALAGAAEWILAVERAGQSEPDLVATVGRVEARPGASNVIAGEARVTLDLRHKLDEVRFRATEMLVRQAQEIARRRELSLERKELLNQPAVAMDAFLVDQVEAAMRKTGCLPHRMASGAGHDAMVLAGSVPAAMIFLRTPGGISHDPAETVKVEDVASAVECGLHLLDQLARCSEFQERIRRA